MTTTHESTDAPEERLTATGSSLVAGEEVRGDAGELRAVDPSTGEPVGPVFALVGTDVVERATRAAADAFPVYRDLEPAARAAFLRRAADEVEAVGDEVVRLAGLETGLPAGRLAGELGRTVGQLRLFADVVEQGDHLRARLDTAQPDRTPLPRPDLRLVHVPVGPVAVFGASNFPLAFSVAGGDTAAALAAGCPVVVKAHGAHPATSELVGRAVARAVAAEGLPGGVFSLLFGPGTEVGQALVADPRITSVGFTGSRSGGRALMAAAAARPVPIPVHAEMSAVNPVVVLEPALGDPGALARDYVASLTLGAGQFCTSPGVLLLPAGPAGDAFAAAAAAAVREAVGQPMLTRGIREARERGAEALVGLADVEEVAGGSAGEGPNAPGPQLLTTTATAFTTRPELQEEVFGAVSLLVRYRGAAELVEAVTALQGQLTATLHAGAADAQGEDGAALVARVVPLLQERAGRVLFDGWPTGVEVSPAMVHGGPWPATSDGRTTSVGTLAIDRFLRPVCYQSAPQSVLPPSLHDDNPWGLVRRVDGVLRLPEVRS
ncbi:aldehyde dehydrogenase (NADP(+)) [uncultured Pseudokineococcus sp.]|uniref:aldehyde dehydrogenase (NADP(+)) n=1 Tax=uncultured Pseudokineococcus sp. TaxID=1642928 RepID=UPI002615B404|nr:aldehyde dehydrogenase (NADP(+)) [uncultured Pseudokineococcus sp.]